MRKCDALCTLIDRYATEFEENEMMWYRPDIINNAECQYIMYKLKKNHNIEFNCLKELKVVRHYLGV